MAEEIVVTLKEYLEKKADAIDERLEEKMSIVEANVLERINALDRLMMTRFDLSNEAIETASTQLTIRMDHANGLIKKYDDQQALFATKEEVRLELDGLRIRADSNAGKIRDLELARSDNTGKMNMVPLVVAVIGAIVSLAVLGVMIFMAIK